MEYVSEQKLTFQRGVFNVICREKLSSFKRPRYVSFCDELPRTSTGKVLKRDLRDTYGEAKND